MVTELGVVIALSTVYIILARGSSFIWSTDARSFRNSADDGAICGLLLGPLLATTMLISALEEDSGTNESWSYLPNGPALADPPWIVEGPVPVLSGQARSSAAASLSAPSLSRCTLLSLQTMISMIFLSHLCASRWTSHWHSQSTQSSWKRLRGFSGVSLLIIGLLWLLREVFGHLGVPLWTGKSPAFGPSTCHALTDSCLLYCRPCAVGNNQRVRPVSSQHVRHLSPGSTKLHSRRARHRRSPRRDSDDRNHESDSCEGEQ